MTPCRLTDFNRWRLVNTVLVLVIPPLVLTSLLVPWYVVSSPEAPSREGVSINFYIDHVESFRFRNGSYRLVDVIYYARFPGTVLLHVFAGTLALSFVVATLAFVALATTLSVDSPRLRRWVAVLLPIFGWTITAYFAISFTLAMQEEQSPWPGFFGSVRIEWAGVSQTYGPGMGWFLAVATATCATVAFLAGRLESGFRRQASPAR